MWGDPEVRTYMCVGRFYVSFRDSTCDVRVLTSNKRSMVSELLYFVIMIIESLII